MKTIYLILGAFALSLCSCTIGVKPDGSKDVIVDAAAVQRAIEVFAEK